MSPSSISPEKTNRIEDFRLSPWITPEVYLRFDLDLQQTIVKAEYKVQKRENGLEPVFLNGEGLEFLSIRINGNIVDPNEFEHVEGGIKILTPPSEDFTLYIENRINPSNNTNLEGLYKSGSMLCTQNEPEGFRKIIYSIDRPDNPMKFRVSIVGDPEIFPVMLCNGNLLAESKLPDGRKECVWEDPYPKPSYLFALVAGDLECTSDEYTTQSGRKIDLKIYVEKGNQNKVGFAFESLKKAMLWDEKTFGLEYDLDLYMIVAVEDFNMGAMENKGLNLFNSKLVLADRKSATDESFESIMAVIAHEYFHNWTGNRVTLQNWFNLTLKEGLTVFRDQWFTEDHTDPSVKRIKDILFLWEHQFPEDQGPMAHPILPKTYVEMNNFYTVTVYEKGAEVIRLISNLIGREKFKDGLKLYLKKYDGMGVTFEEFISSMEEVYGHKIPYIRNWYHRKGTPILKINEHWDQNSQTLNIHFKDTNAAEYPLVYANKMAFFDREGKVLDEVNVQILGESFSYQKSFSEKPIVSYFRGLSSPIKFDLDDSVSNQIFLAKHETDGVSRFFAFQKMLHSTIYESIQKDSISNIDSVLEVFHFVFSKDWDKTYTSYFLSFPSLSQISESIQLFDFEKIHRVRTLLVTLIGNTFEKEFQNLYEENRKNLPEQNREDIGKRRLKNLALYYLLYKGGYEKLALVQQKEAKHMSEELSAFRMLCEMNSEEKDAAADIFYEKWKNDSIVLDSWFAAQVSFGKNQMENLIRLEKHQKFQIKNPNKVRALYFSFARNPLSFHAEDGSGYQLIRDRILQLNAINPQIASGLAKLYQSAFLQSGNRPSVANECLLNIKNLPHLSRELGEVVGTLLKPK
ncbi:aminopeptidase N [Leptospira sp. 96542]|nr:aminopeptidase N [Leptospira sp. 96542]